MKFGELLMASQMDGGIEDPKKKKESLIAKEMRILSKRNLPFDNKPVLDVIKSVATKTGVSPSLLMSSAFQEGMNKAINNPDEVSIPYDEAQVKGLIPADYPVDAFWNYGIDQFDKYLPSIQKDLPEGFDQRYKTYQAKNEKGEPINTVAFKTNEDALLVKSLILKNALSEVDNYAKERGVTLDDKSRNYLALAKYNSAEENFPIMFDEVSKAKDRDKFITGGLTRRKGVHTNIYPRIENMSVAEELLNPKQVQNPLGNVQVAPTIDSTQVAPPVVAPIEKKKTNW
jgi:hypothetical protein